METARFTTDSKLELQGTPSSPNQPLGSLHIDANAYMIDNSLGDGALVSLYAPDVKGSLGTIYLRHPYFRTDSCRKERIHQLERNSVPSR